MEEYTITAVRNGAEKKIGAKKGESLLEALVRHDIYLSAACGGTGRCGKCGVQMCKGATEIKEADRLFFTEAQLQEGMRLACEAYPQSDCRIVIETGDEADFEVVTEYQENDAAEAKKEKTDEDCFLIGIDIGTTTIAVSLVGCASRKIYHTVTVVNHQRAYGADVISRIQAANDGKLPELTHSIRKDLYTSMERLLEETGGSFTQIQKIAIAGNTTMGHLLMGYSCETLGVYPFDPVNIGTIETDFTGLFGAAAKEAGAKEEYGIPVVLLPGISTYVGADISAGMLFNGFDASNKVDILVDLGTNGEMAIGNKDKILVTSTAAGPAFEGGNISCGMGSVQGAICQVRIDGTKAECKTIKDAPPLGLCGTGVIETAYELLKEEWLDETGMLEEDYFDDGFVLAQTPDGQDIAFTQKDVREIQLAKSAVRAGLETLLLRYGVTYDDIGTLYLAGGFGYRMDLDKAVGIGLLPEELLDRTTAVGNSSLGGTVTYLTDPDAQRRMERIVQVSEEIPLASDKDFNRFYTDYMVFE